MNSWFRETLEKFYPADPIRISFSKLKIFLLFLLILGAASFIYLRSQNKTELEILKEKHVELQQTVRNYLISMSRANVDEEQLNKLQSEMNNQRKQLNEIEEKINKIRSFWFLD